MAAHLPIDAGAEVRAPWLAAALAQQRRRLILWLPVAMAAGIGVFFVLPDEPGAAALPWLAALLLAPVLLAMVGGRGVGLVLALTGALAAVGFGAAMARVRLVAAPVLAAPVTALVEGRLREITQSSGGLPRLTLDRLTIYGLAAAETPSRVRVTLRRADQADRLMPGVRLSVLADLAAPGGPIAPGAFDFRRVAWFEALGAIGTARGRLAVLPPETGDHDAAVTLARLRARVSAWLRLSMGGEAGAFAAAIVTGDRSGLPVTALSALRDSNLAHLLAISGLHMAIVCGLAFALVRHLLVLVPGIALHWPVKALAAMAGLLAAVSYLLLSGGAVATQRAGLMAAVALLGILVGRPALGLRGLALAATVILLLTPESLLSVGFQMSFAATLALVAFYEAVRESRGLRPAVDWRQRLGRYFLGIVFTSVIAGLATAPFAAWHFNRLAPWGLVANLAAVPVMGLWVAPLLALGALLAPLGLERLPLGAAALGIDTILLVARWVARLPGAVQPIAATAAAPLLLLSAGGLWLCLWRGRLRCVGLGAVVGALVLWLVVELPRPVARVAPHGDVVSVRGPQGLAVDRPRAARYVIDGWLRREGDATDQDTAIVRPGFTSDGIWQVAELGHGWRLLVSGSRRPSVQALAQSCTSQTVLVLPRARVPEMARKGCIVLDQPVLADGAARAIFTHEDGGLKITDSRASSRFWTGASP